MKNTIAVGISLILASAVSVLASAIASNIISVVFCVIAWFVYLGLGLYVVSPVEDKDKPASDKPSP